VSTAAGTDRARVLVVEDEPDHRRALTLTLRLGGYEPYESASGEEALATLGAIGAGLAPAGRGPDGGTGPAHPGALPDAVVVDIRLPGMDGVALLERLRAAVPTRDLPIVLVSAHATIPTVVHEDPRSRFLPKPFHPEQLLEQLLDLLADRAGHAS
jgi:CheY-like chemotaxis protein